MQTTPVTDSTRHTQTCKPRSAPLDSALADHLLDKLSSDDEFRERFTQDPTSALESIGFGRGKYKLLSTTDLLPKPFSACNVVQLASKSAIAAARNELKVAVTQGLAYISPNFEAKTLEGRNRRS